MIRTLAGLTLTAVAIVGALISSDRIVHANDVQSTATGAALATIARFHTALARGDSAAAAQLLASDATILESGDVETRAQYLAHHLGADIEFARAVPSTRTVVDSRRQGDVVWAVATSSTKGTFRDRPINSLGAELIVLSKSGNRWLIRSIHWSSHRAAP